MKKINRMNNSNGQEDEQMNNRVCYIVGAGVLKENSFNMLERGLLIAADGGYTALENAGIIPDFIIGDFDSLEKIPEGIPIEAYSKEKDETDMMIAVNKGFELGYQIFVIYGGLGGRLEHSMANIQLLTHIAKKGCRGYLIQGDDIITVLNQERYLIRPQDKGYISIFSLSEVAKGITLKGVKYLLVDFTLTSDNPMGVSNEFIGEEVSIEVKNGSLLVIWRSQNPVDSLFT